MKYRVGFGRCSAVFMLLQASGCGPAPDLFVGVSADGSNACSLRSLATTAKAHVRGSRDHISFTDVTQSVGFPAKGGMTVSTVDLNHDGRADVFAPGDGSGDADVYLNCADAAGDPRFVALGLKNRITIGDGILDTPVASHSIDLDGDGRQDLIVASARTVQVLFQKDGLHFESRQIFHEEHGGSIISSVVPILVRSTPSGPPDLLVARRGSGQSMPGVPVPEASTRFLINDGHGAFTDRTDAPELAEVRIDGEVHTYGFIDVPATVPNQFSLLWRVRDTGAGGAREMRPGSDPSALMQFGPNVIPDSIAARTGMGADLQILDDQSVLVAIAETAKVTLLRRGTDGVVTSAAPLLTEPSVTYNYWDGKFEDFNLDGAPDLVFATAVGGLDESDRAQRAQVFDNSTTQNHPVLFAGASDGTFHEVSATAGPVFDGSSFTDTMRASVADIDGDGYPDLVIAPYSLVDGGSGYKTHVRIMLNDGQSAGNYLVVRLNEALQGSQGAVIEVTTHTGKSKYGAHRLMRGVNGADSRDVHIGLGDEVASRVTLRWRDGTTQEFPLADDQTLLSVDSR